VRGHHHDGQFIDATIDVWDIPTESATRVGHPAPFPVELPRRLIELYTYRGDLVLDPFIGNRGRRPFAAVRTERHFVGFDTDEDYVALALRAGDPGAGRPARSQPPRHRPARPALHGRRRGRGEPRPEGPPAGRAGPDGQWFEHIEPNVAYGDLGIAVDFRARDAAAVCGCSTCPVPTRPPDRASGGPMCS